jgi:hypothetical protein
MVEIDPFTDISKKIVGWEGPDDDQNPRYHAQIANDCHLR